MLANVNTNEHGGYPQRLIRQVKPLTLTAASSLDIRDQVPSSQYAVFCQARVNTLQGEINSQGRERCPLPDISIPQIGGTLPRNFWNFRSGYALPTISKIYSQQPTFLSYIIYEGAPTRRAAYR